MGVRATFFINSDNLHTDDQAEVARNKESLIRMVRSRVSQPGHVSVPGRVTRPGHASRPRVTPPRCR